MSQSAPIQDAQALIELYYDKGWTDGLPVVPPSEASVGAMLAGAGLHGDEVIGEIPDRNVRVTADKVAINAVLAGCRPEYMPVVVAAIKGICHPDYCYHGAATSTGGSSIALIVNGPIAAELGIDLGFVLIIIGQRGMNLPQVERKIDRQFFGDQTAINMTGDDIHEADVCAGDDRLTAAHRRIVPAAVCGEGGRGDRHRCRNGPDRERSPPPEHMLERDGQAAAERGVKFVCSTDAHAVSHLEFMRYAVDIARRAGMTKEQVANTNDLAAFGRMLKRKR